MYHYIFRYTIIQPVTPRLKFGEMVIGGVKLAWQEDAITGTYEIDEIDDAKALAKADEVTKCVGYALSLHSGIPFLWEAPKLVSRTGKDGHGQMQNLFEQAVIRERVDVVQPVGDQFVKEVEDELLRFPKTGSAESWFLARIHHWWVRALWDQDPVDKFVDLYVACEVVGKECYPSDGPTQRVKKMLRRNSAEIGGNSMAGKITKLRGDLFHSGNREDEANGWNPKLDAVVRKEMARLLI